MKRIFEVAKRVLSIIQKEIVPQIATSPKQKNTTKKSLINSVTSRDEAVNSSLKKKIPPKTLEPKKSQKKKTITKKSTKKSPIKKEVKLVPTHDFKNDLKILSSDLKSQLAEDSRYSGGIIKSQIRQGITSTKLNIIYLYTIRLVNLISSKQRLSSIEISSLKADLSEHLKFINNQVDSNKRYKGALIEAHNAQLKLCISVIKLNELLLSWNLNEKLNLQIKSIENEIQELENLSAKYKPCLVKNNIDMNIAVMNIFLNIFCIVNNEDFKLVDLKKLIKNNMREIEKYKLSLYPVLLSIRVKTYKILLMKNSAIKLDEKAKIKQELKTEIEVLNREIKKYAPCTLKYLLTIDREFSELTINY